MHSVTDLRPALPQIFLRRELLASGLSHQAILNLTRAGWLVRVRHGAYVHGDAWVAADDRERHQLEVRAVLRQSRAEMVVSHLSALREWDVATWDAPVRFVDVTRVDQRAGRRGAGVRQHLGQLRPEDVTHLNGVSVTSPTRTALDCMTLLDVERGLVITNELLRRRLTSTDDLRAGQQFMRQWPRTLRQVLVLDLSTDLCESVGESRLVYACWRERLPRPRLQMPVIDGRGQVVARTDLAWPELGVFAEFDGRVKYGALLRTGETASDAVVREKRREDLIRELTGWSCIRVTWADLDDPRRLAQRIREAFGRQVAVRQSVRLVE